jgi:hypothetical protein
MKYLMIDFDARWLDETAPSFTTPDPLAEKYYSISPYAYCLNNPIRYVDPDGRSTWVMSNGDGTYRVFNGNLKDNDLNIYVYTKVDGILVRGESIGITSSITSFYNDAKDNGGQPYGWMGTIDPNDKSGLNFLGYIFSNAITMDDYIANAGNFEAYDFKSVGLGDRKGLEKERYYYRGMPIATHKGVTMYTSARDIGNIAAGYIAAANGMTWSMSRVAFDLYQTKQNGLGIEGLSTRNAQYLGYNIGYRSNSTRIQLNNLINTAVSFTASMMKPVANFINWLTSW